MHDTVLVAAISDTHWVRFDESTIPPCDLLLVAGDAMSECPDLPDFIDRLQSRAGQVIAVRGNHDRDQDVPYFRSLPWIYLEDEEYVTEHGLKVYGTPWSNYLAPRWHAQGFENKTQADATHMPYLADKWAAIPDDTDILITHSPPRWGDLVHGAGHVGSLSLTERLGELEQLQLHVFGHIHEGARDARKLRHGWSVNVCVLHEGYRSNGLPVVSTSCRV